MTKKHAKSSMQKVKSVSDLNKFEIFLKKNPCNSKL